MLIAERSPFVQRQLASRNDRIADLAAVHVLLDKLIDVVPNVVELDTAGVKASESGKEVAPNLFLLSDGQVLVAQGQLDTGFETPRRKCRHGWR